MNTSEIIDLYIGATSSQIAQSGSFEPISELVSKERFLFLK